MEKYKCHICKKKHSVYYSSTGGIPKFLLEIRMNEELDRIEELSDDFLLIDKEKVIVRGNIMIETNFTENSIFHEAWISIPLYNYLEQIEQTNGKPLLELTGEIASELPFFQNLVGLAAKWSYSEKQGYAKIDIVDESQLRKDQSKPISKDRVIEMMQLIHHPELYKKKKIFEKQFQERFNEILTKAKLEFSAKSKLFLIDISNLKEVLVQLISSEMLSNAENNGIGIHLSNDEANENFTEVQERMSLINKDAKFRRFKLDNIETYQKKYEFGDTKLFDELKLICESIYEQNIDELEIEISEM